MFPFSFEWIWDMGHLVFHGGLWYALTILGLGMKCGKIKMYLSDAVQLKICLIQGIG